MRKTNSSNSHCTLLFDAFSKQQRHYSLRVRFSNRKLHKRFAYTMCKQQWQHCSKREWAHLHTISPCALHISKRYCFSPSSLAQQYSTNTLPRTLLNSSHNNNNNISNVQETDCNAVNNIGSIITNQEGEFKSEQISDHANAEHKLTNATLINQCSSNNSWPTTTTHDTVVQPVSSLSSVNNIIDNNNNSNDVISPERYYVKSVNDNEVEMNNVKYKSSSYSELESLSLDAALFGYINLKSTDFAASVNAPECICSEMPLLEKWVKEELFVESDWMRTCMEYFDKYKYNIDKTNAITTCGDSDNNEESNSNIHIADNGSNNYNDNNNNVNDKVNENEEVNCVSKAKINSFRCKNDNFDHFDKSDNCTKMFISIVGRPKLLRILLLRFLQNPLYWRDSVDEILELAIRKVVHDLIDTTAKESENDNENENTSNNINSNHVNNSSTTMTKRDVNKIYCCSEETMNEHANALLYNLRVYFAKYLNEPAHKFNFYTPALFDKFVTFLETPQWEFNDTNAVWDAFVIANRADITLLLSPQRPPFSFGELHPTIATEDLQIDDLESKCSNNNSSNNNENNNFTKIVNDNTKLSSSDKKYMEIATTSLPVGDSNIRHTEKDVHVCENNSDCITKNDMRTNSTVHNRDSAQILARSNDNLINSVESVVADDITTSGSESTEKMSMSNEETRTDVRRIISAEQWEKMNEYKQNELLFGKAAAELSLRLRPQNGLYVVHYNHEFADNKYAADKLYDVNVNNNNNVISNTNNNKNKNQTFTEHDNIATSSKVEDTQCTSTIKSLTSVNGETEDVIYTRNTADHDLHTSEPNISYNHCINNNNNNNCVNSINDNSNKEEDILSVEKHTNLYIANKSVLSETLKTNELTTTLTPAEKDEESSERHCYDIDRLLYSVVERFFSIEKQTTFSEELNSSNANTASANEFHDAQDTSVANLSLAKSLSSQTYIDLQYSKNRLHKIIGWGLTENTTNGKTNKTNIGSTKKRKQRALRELYYTNAHISISGEQGEIEDLHLSKLWDVFVKTEMSELISIYESVYCKFDRIKEEICAELLAQSLTLLIFMSRQEVRAVTRPDQTYYELWYLHAQICKLLRLWLFDLSETCTIKSCKRLITEHYEEQEKEQCELHEEHYIAAKECKRYAAWQQNNIWRVKRFEELTEETQRSYTCFTLLHQSSKRSDIATELTSQDATGKNIVSREECLLEEEEEQAERLLQKWEEVTDRSKEDSLPSPEPELELAEHTSLPLSKMTNAHDVESRIDTKWNVKTQYCEEEEEEIEEEECNLQKQLARRRKDDVMVNEVQLLMLEEKVTHGVIAVINNLLQYLANIQHNELLENTTMSVKGASNTDDIESKEISKRENDITEVERCKNHTLCLSPLTSNPIIASYLTTKEGVKTISSMCVKHVLPVIFSTLQCELQQQQQEGRWELKKEALQREEEKEREKQECCEMSERVNVITKRKYTKRSHKDKEQYLNKRESIKRELHKRGNAEDAQEHISEEIKEKLEKEESWPIKLQASALKERKLRRKITALMKVKEESQKVKRRRKVDTQSSKRQAHVKEQEQEQEQERYEEQEHNEVRQRVSKIRNAGGDKKIRDVSNARKNSISIYRTKSWATREAKKLNDDLVIAPWQRRKAKMKQKDDMSNGVDVSAMQSDKERIKKRTYRRKRNNNHEQIFNDYSQEICL